LHIGVHVKENTSRNSLYIFKQEENLQHFYDTAA